MKLNYSHNHRLVPNRQKKLKNHNNRFFCDL